MWIFKLVQCIFCVQFTFCEHCTFSVKCSFCLECTFWILYTCTQRTFRIKCAITVQCVFSVQCTLPVLFAFSFSWKSCALSVCHVLTVYFLCTGFLCTVCLISTVYGLFDIGPLEYLDPLQLPINGPCWQALLNINTYFGNVCIAWSKANINAHI